MKNDSSRSKRKIARFQKQMLCRRCGREMQRVADVLPFGGSPGLIAFFCTECGTSESTLVYPGDQGGGPWG
jgi:hypothetical protein